MYSIATALLISHVAVFFFFSSRRRHTRSDRDWSSDVCSSDLGFDERIVVVHLTVALGAPDDRLVYGFRIDRFNHLERIYSGSPLQPGPNSEIGRASCRERV